MRIIITILLISSIVTGIFTAGYKTAEHRAEINFLKQLKTQNEVNNKLSNELTLQKESQEKREKELTNEVSRLNDNLSQCGISNKLLLKFKQSAGQVQYTSELSDSNVGIIGMGESDSGLTAEDLSENYVHASSAYVNCAKQYNGLLKVLGYDND